VTSRLWATASGVRIEVLEWAPAAVLPSEQGYPVLCVPGALGPAESFRELGLAMASGDLGGRPRRCLAVSLRGRGASEAPPSGYRLRDLVEDIHAAAAVAGLAAPGTGLKKGEVGHIVLGQSMGVPQSVRYALDVFGGRSPGGSLRGLALGDSPARLRRVPGEDVWRWAPESFTDWDDAFEWDHREFGVTREVFDRPKYRAIYYRLLPGGRVGLNFSPAAALRVQEESADIDLRADLGRLACPVLVLRANRATHIPDEWVDIYRTGLPDGEVVTVNSDHGVFESEEGRACLSEFLTRCDAAAASGGHRTAAADSRGDSPEH
jgi:pimeloyl-ACP methyl ester carboxylesterase